MYVNMQWFFKLIVFLPLIPLMILSLIAARNNTPPLPLPPPYNTPPWILICRRSKKFSGMRTKDNYWYNYPGNYPG